MVVQLAASKGTSKSLHASTTDAIRSPPAFKRTRICSDTTTALSTNRPSAMISAAIDIISSSTPTLGINANAINTVEGTRIPTISANRMPANRNITSTTKKNACPRFTMKSPMDLSTY